MEKHQEFLAPVKADNSLTQQQKDLIAHPGAPHEMLEISVADLSGAVMGPLSDFFSEPQLQVPEWEVRSLARSIIDDVLQRCRHKEPSC